MPNREHQRSKADTFDSEKAPRPPQLPIALFETRDMDAFWQFFIDLAVIVLSAFLALKWYFLYPISILLIGARQRGLAELLHQASHRVLAKTDWLNRSIGTLCGYLVFQTWTAYRGSHVPKHHGQFGKGADPDFEFHLDIGLYGNVSWLMLWDGFLKYGRYLVINRLLAAYGNYKELARLIALWIVLCASFGPKLLVMFWIVPMFFGHAPIGYLVEISEHWPLMRNRGSLYQTRNRASHWLEGVLFSTHRENFHLIHHLYPRLPNRSYVQADQFLTETWPEYRNWKEANGGIILSANGAPSVLQIFWNLASVR